MDGESIGEESGKRQMQNSNTVKKKKNLKKKDIKFRPSLKNP